MALNAMGLDHRLVSETRCNGVCPAQVHPHRVRGVLYPGELLHVARHMSRYFNRAHLDMS